MVPGGKKVGLFKSPGYFYFFEKGEDIHHVHFEMREFLHHCEVITWKKNGGG